MTASTTVVSLDTKKRARKLSGGALTSMTFDLTFAVTRTTRRTTSWKPATCRRA